jgi:hypothetical protein
LANDFLRAEPSAPKVSAAMYSPRGIRTMRIASVSSPRISNRRGFSNSLSKVGLTMA